MIDIETERLVLLTEAPQHVPGRPHISTLIRWSRRGVKGVHLETLLVGGRRYTSVEATRRFVARLSHSQQSPVDTPAASPLRGGDPRVQGQLDAAGI